MKSRAQDSENNLIFAGMREIENSEKPIVKLNNAHYGALDDLA
jgi:hypothetical protein